MPTQYFFAPVYVADWHGRPRYEPGTVVDGELVSAFELLPPRSQLPVCDREITPMRFVACMPDGWLAPADWTPISQTEASDAYPGKV